MNHSHPSHSLTVDLHQLAKTVNLVIPVAFLGFLLAGLKLSFFFHFGTVAFLMLTLLNLFYLKVQRRHVLLANFGLIGQLRYLMESVGPEFRQYFFASDTEETPFNRIERAEVYRKAKNVESAASFGSQAAFDSSEIKLRHSMFPIAPTERTPFALEFGNERGLENRFTLHHPVLISAMSFGALGAPAVRSLARGAAKAGIPMNTGEGGYPKYHLEEEADLIFQLGTAKFGVRSLDGTLDENKLAELASHPRIRMIEIKLSQGAKPGKGGLLPKEKLSPEIAELRGVPMGKDVLSPSSHVECTNPQTTIAFIDRIQQITQLPVGIKLCMGHPEEFHQLVQSMAQTDITPDWITIDGSEGGTGAAPKSFLDSVGMPLLPALATANRILIQHGIRGRTKLLASGKLISPARQIIAMALGADAIYTARGFMLALGCIQALQCGNNTCPVGITTHDPQLQRGFDLEVRSNRIGSYAHHLQKDLQELLSACGCRSFRELNHDHLFIPSGSILANFPFPSAPHPS